MVSIYVLEIWDSGWLSSLTKDSGQCWHHSIHNNVVCCQPTTGLGSQVYFLQIKMYLYLLGLQKHKTMDKCAHCLWMVKLQTCYLISVALLSLFQLACPMLAQEPYNTTDKLFVLFFFPLPVCALLYQKKMIVGWYQVHIQLPKLLAFNKIKLNDAFANTNLRSFLSLFISDWSSAFKAFRDSRGAFVAVQTNQHIQNLLGLTVRTSQTAVYEFIHTVTEEVKSFVCWQTL